MRIAVALAGTTGDVAPYTGVAARLVTRGHDVVIAAPRDLAAHVDALGLATAPLPASARDQVADVAPPTGPLGRFATMRRLSGTLAESGELLARSLLPVVADADVVVLSPMTVLMAPLLDGLGPTTLGLYLQPLLPTRAHAPSFLGVRSLGGPANLASARAYLQAVSRPHWPLIQRMRAEQGLAPIGDLHGYHEAALSAGWTVVQGFSRHVVPDPPDLPAGVRTVGYCWPAPDPAWRPDARLVDFLADGPAPVVVTFGSMPLGDAGAVRRTLVGAASRAGVRLVLQSGWGSLADPTHHDPDVLDVGHVPHEWLFARASAVVHHAGAGTTAAGLRAGIPAVPVPVLLDQPFWADRLHRLGVAPRPLPLGRLNVGRLADALRAATTDTAMRRRATELGRLIAAEDGAGAAADVIEQVGGAPTR